MTLLTSNNYQQWKYNITAVLQSKGVLDIVTGEEACPEDSSDQNQKNLVKNWKKQDALARFLIALSLDIEHHAYMRDCNTYKKVWDTLVNMQENKTTSSRLAIFPDWYSYTWQPGDNVSFFLSGLGVVTTQATTLGVMLDDVTIMGKIIDCLPSQFDSFRNSWRLVTSDSTTLDDLKGLLLAGEVDMKCGDCSSYMLIRNTSSNSSIDQILQMRTLQSYDTSEEYIPCLSWGTSWTLIQILYHTCPIYDYFLKLSVYMLAPNLFSGSWTFFSNFSLIKLP